MRPPFTDATYHGHCTCRRTSRTTTTYAHQHALRAAHAPRAPHHAALHTYRTLHLPGGHVTGYCPCTRHTTAPYATYPHPHTHTAHTRHTLHATTASHGHSAPYRMRTTTLHAHTLAPHLALTATCCKHTHLFSMCPSTALTCLPASALPPPPHHTHSYIAPPSVLYLPTHLPLHLPPSTTSTIATTLHLCHMPFIYMPFSLYTCAHYLYMPFTQPLPPHMPPAPTLPSFSACLACLPCACLCYHALPYLHAHLLRTAARVHLPLPRHATTASHRLPRYRWINAPCYALPARCLFARVILTRLPCARAAAPPPACLLLPPHRTTPARMPASWAVVAAAWRRH